MRSETLRFLGEFINVAGQSFEDYRLPFNIKFARTAGWLVAFLMPFGSLLDWVIYPHHANEFLVIRLAAGLVGLLTVGLSYVPFFQRHIFALGLAPVLVTALAIECMILRSDGYASSYYAGLNLCVLGFCIGFHWRVSETLVACSLILLIWLVPALLSVDSLLDRDFVNNLYFLALTSAIAVAVSMTRYSSMLREHRGHLHLRELSSSLEAANEMLRSVDEAKSRFFANASHELRTPLVSLNASVQMMLEEGVTVKQEKLITTSQHALEDMLDNINDILLKARVEQGQLEASWSEIDVASFVERCLSLFRPLAERRGVSLQFVNDLPAETKAFVDRRHLRKIINNLVGNALKFTAIGVVEVTLFRERDTWKLKVRDTGTGIPEADLVNIFDAFVQASNNHNRDVQGSGLGLALVRDLAALHRGSVVAESKLDQGSTFTVTFPLGEAHVDARNLDASDINVQRDERVNLKLKDYDELDLRPFQDHVDGRPRVLVVEDNPQVVQSLGYVLCNDCNLFFARDGREGLEQARALMPDLILSDVMMPFLNGYELVKAVKDDPKLRQIPLILLTSKADKGARIQGYEVGADEYLSKPFDNREVRVRIFNLVRRRKIEMDFVQSERLASVGTLALGTLARGLAHEINNPLVPIRQAPEFVQEYLLRVMEGSASLPEVMPKIEGHLASIKRSGQFIHEITKALHGYARPGETGYALVDLHEAIDNTLHILIASQACQHIVFAKHYQLDALVECVPGHINQVWMNLLQNAVQAVEGVQEPRVDVRTFGDAAYACIEVSDNGCGIPQGQRLQVFDFLFTTKAPGRGTGMGLYHVKQIVDLHHGLVEVDSVEGQGSCFRVTLPLKATLPG